jgi:hypothetical protein
MPTYETPEPITATIELVVANVRLVASNRHDTVVQVHPSDLSHEADVRVAEQTRVEYSAGRLLIKAPKQRGLSLFGRTGSIDVTIECPAGSTLDSDAAVADLRCLGRLGECRIKIATGDIHLDETGPLQLSTGAGTIVVNQVDGDARVSTGSGKIRLGHVDGTAVVKNSNGDNVIGTVTRDLQVKTANGEVTIDRAGAGVNAATANGDIRVGDVTRGSIALKSGFGKIEIGIRPGTAALLDVFTAHGRVQNHLDAVDSPQPSDATVDVRARTAFGDILIRRAHPTDSPTQHPQTSDSTL